MHTKWIALASLLVACSSKAKEPAGPPLRSRVPQVANEGALLRPDARMPKVVVAIGDHGAITVAEAPVAKDPWKQLAAKPPKPLETVELRDLHRSIAMLEEGIKPGDPVDLDVAMAPSDPSQEDPPPPEPEDEDEGDESGGTGTAMALDEGKMGKQEQRVGGLGRFASLTRGDTISGGFGFPREESTSELPSRLGETVGTVREHGESGRAQAIVLAAPAADAGLLVSALTEARALLAVEHQGTLRALRVEFDTRDFAIAVDDAAWLELRLSPSGVELEAPPNLAVTVPWGTDAAPIAKAYREVRARHGLDERTDVDVLVGANVDAQRLVDVLVALDGAGARSLVLGHAPAADSAEAGKRGHRIQRVALGQPAAVGDLDKAIIRRTIKGRLAEVKACYQKTLAMSPEANGTVVLEFFIAPNGKVAASKANGVDPSLASCLADLIAATEFPTPKGGGGVQVRYPLTFRN